jgi:DNA-directed RNA polymerase subunit M/transcription elongation factor TFIIS
MGTELRAYARDMFARLFGMEESSVMVQNAERGVYNFSVSDCRARGISCSWEDTRFRSTYRQKLNGLLFNLRNPKNPELLQHVLNKSIETKHLAFLKPEELDPKLWVDINARVAKRFPTSAADLEVPESALLQCGRCKSKRCSFYEMQIRSADEPSECAVPDRLRLISHAG